MSGKYFRLAEDVKDFSKIIFFLVTQKWVSSTIFALSPRKYSYVTLVLRTTCLAKVTLFREYVTSDSIYALATVYHSVRLLCTNFSTSLRRIVPSKLVCLDVDDIGGPSSIGCC